jgi:chromosome segregation ATPase
MNIFKRLAALEAQNANLALKCAELEKLIAALTDEHAKLEKRLEDITPNILDQFGDIERFEEGVNNILLYSAGNKGGDG